MSYQVIARKWRPQIFKELVGQDHISQTLLNAIRSERIPHALLFTGPRGTGKTSAARILAKSLRCPNAKDFVPCGECADCENIADSRSLDVIEIDGASNNGVEAVRELRDTVSYRPTTGKYKIYIIDEVHMLTGSAFNALLKTLEEPPEHVLFIMATTEAQKIPNTVLSRCQRFDFRKISTRLIADHLESICKKENVKAESEAIWTVARSGDGSMRDSQSLLEQVISFCDGHLTLKKVTEVLGLTDRALLTGTVSALITRDTQAIVKIIANIFDAGYDPMVFIKDLLEELRHLVLVKVAPEQINKVVDLPQEEIASLSELAAKLSEEDIHLLFDMALKGASDLYKAQDSRVVLEMILLRMSIAPRIENLMQMKSSRATISNAHVPTTTVAASVSVASSNASNSNAPATTSSYTPAEPAPLTPPTSGASDLNERWHEFVERVRKVNGLIAAKLEQLQLLELNNNKEALIGVSDKYKFLYPQVSDAGFQKKVVNYLNTFWGPGYSVKVQMIDAQKTEALSPTQLQNKKRENEKEMTAKQVADHPIVKQAQSIFKTQIKSIREN